MNNPIRVGLLTGAVAATLLAGQGLAHANAKCDAALANGVTAVQKTEMCQDYYSGTTPSDYTHEDSTPDSPPAVLPKGKEYYLAYNFDTKEWESGFREKEG